MVEAAGMQTVTVADLGAALMAGELGVGEVAGFKSALFDSMRSSPSDPSSPSRRRRRASTGAVELPRGRDRSMSKGAATMSMADWATSTMALGSSPASPAAGDSRRSSPSTRRDKKRLQTLQPTSLSQAMDEAAEHVVNRTVEQPWCMESCMHHPSCVRICFPAEHATRQKRGRQNAKPSAVAREGSMTETASELALQSFGLPDFEQAGYRLVTSEESGAVDPLVEHVLGLVVAVHNKTSLQRYCLAYPKAKLLPSTGVTEMRTLLRSLRRCDHANVLTYLEGFEDTSQLYLMYEYFPCYTLRSVMEQQMWTQEQIVNMIREMCAAVAFASTVNVVHLGFTFCHVLIPAASLQEGDPMLSKIFGFGLFGALYGDTGDHLCWAPEALERYNQLGKEGNFVQKMEVSMRQACDAWSLGVLAFTLVAKQPPMTSEQMILVRRWCFTLAIDMMDLEAKSLIEGFLHSTSDRRLRPDRALHHEWLRRRWRPPPGGVEIIVQVEEFCMSPLSKRLFGRFLTNFLQPEHFRRIAKYFYALDQHGTGFLSMRELDSLRKMAQRPHSSTVAIFKWLAAGGNTISLSRFVECFAEEVIDGRALWHAFESLDDDGSEEVTAEELFSALRTLDDNGDLTVDEVVEYIESCEGAAGGTADQNHRIDYKEFCELFPVRVQRMKAITDRISSERKGSEHLCEQFGKHFDNVKAWVNNVDKVLQTVSNLSAQTLDRSEAGIFAAKALRKEFVRIDELLKQPPGPLEVYEFENLAAQHRRMQARSKQKAKSGARGKGSKDPAKAARTIKFDSFLQDQALVDAFPTMIAPDIKTLKDAVDSSSKVSGNVDQVRAHDAATNVYSKVSEALGKAKGQLQEYEAFVEAMGEPEAEMMANLGGVLLSGRGLRMRYGEGGDDPLGAKNVDLEDGANNPMARFLSEVAQRFSVS